MGIEMKNTPGPWKYDKVTTSCGYCFRIGSSDQLEQERGSRTAPSYACLYVDYGSYAEQAEANARLIASAPDLLVACEEYLHAIAGESASGRSKALKSIRTAIAKATGKELAA